MCLLSPVFKWECTKFTSFRTVREYKHNLSVVNLLCKESRHLDMLLVYGLRLNAMHTVNKYGGQRGMLFIVRPDNFALLHV